MLERKLVRTRNPVTWEGVVVMLAGLVYMVGEKVEV
jgi:hypothetical protein